MTDGARAGLDAAVAFFVESVARADPHARAHPTEEGRRLVIGGIVQGVGFRPWAARKARALGLRGSVFNTSAGVVIEAFGQRDALDALESSLSCEPPAAARIDSIARAVVSVPPPSTCPSFTIGSSVESDARGMPLPADLAVCDACLADVHDARDRHHGYAFTSCTDCGPRFSIVTDLPYDRARTTMAGFASCDACAAEHDDAQARRYHAQTLACPSCGPRLWLVDASGGRLDGDPVEEAANRLLEGAIVAIRGLGAFHLACDATRDAPVRELRRRKRRDAKPFAVMVADLEMAEGLARLDEVARAALSHPARPIVLAPTRDGSAREPDEPSVSREVLGPSRRIGLMLPYTPLHHLLLERVRRPLVMTSGNVSGEPVVIENDDALRTLGPIADVQLHHDRPIARRVEDSVVSVHARTTTMIRRARGHAPRPIRLPAASPEPVLAVGAQLKSTVCVVVEDRAYLSPHLGDLDTIESERAWLQEVAGLERLLRVRPDVVAHDLHPDYGSTRAASARQARLHHGVQHHVAHVLAAVAELHLEGPVLGVAFDGTGWGPDGTAWGGELLLVDGLAWQRLATTRPIALAGGEVAIREVWRQALALLVDAFGSDAPGIFDRFACLRDVAPEARHTIERMIETGVSTVGARGVGRYFDAVGALALGIPRAAFEGHVAMALEEAAMEGWFEPYPWAPPAELATHGPVSAAHELDLRPTTRAMVDALSSGAPAGLVSARFHETLIAATAALVERALAETAARQVVLTGGAFQNRRLASHIARRIGEGRVRIAREVPVNDGGIALGQAWSAVLALRSEARSR
ncbi:MAG: carbamoyltransferase HypF [Deltaproteobacteria bacterium]|nr:carbamoyltransferase HypF [Deltaproteobacteria bacterium]